jgi:hypothetical protein
MCDLNIERLKVLTGTVEPLSEECRACRQRLRIDSNNEVGTVGNPGSMGNEAQAMITFSPVHSRPCIRRQETRLRLSLSGLLTKSPRGE